MKKENILWAVLLICLLAGSLYTIINEKEKIIEIPEDFTQLHKGQLYINGEHFFPLTLNYKIDIRGNDKELWPTSSSGYDLNPNNHYNDKDSCLLQLKAELQLIKEMGFNSIRVVGIGEPVYSQKENPLKIIYLHNGEYKNILLNTEENYSRYFKAIDELLELAHEAKLRVVFLLQMRPGYKESEKLLQKMAIRFKENSTILAYDLFNEPLYFDSLRHEKLKVYPIVKKWNSILKSNSPYHLSTIGLSGIREVFGWDPNILDVDFISYHPYEYEPQQVMNELYWYGEYTNKPWMLGETSFSADNDSVPYSLQADFAQKTLKQAVNCGAIGYSWWQYKDVEWGDDFHQNYMGVVAQHGEMKMNDFPLAGTPKGPTVDVFKNFDFNQKPEKPLFLENYYNYSSSTDFRLKGRLVDEKNKPIKGGVILVWSEWWNFNRHSVTKSDGTFEILADFEIYHWMLSAVEKTYTRGDINPSDAKPDAKDNIPTIDIGTFKVYSWKLDKNVIN